MRSAVAMNWVELCERARAGERAAARSLYDAAAPAVYRQCLLAVRGDADAAKDLSQECWVRVFRQLRQLQKPEAFVSWSLATATAHLASARRLDLRRARLLEAFAAEASLDSPSADEHERAHREGLVREVLAQVEPPSARALALLVYVEGRTTRDAAEVLGLPHGTVTVTLMRLRQKLRAHLARGLALEESP